MASRNSSKSQEETVHDSICDSQPFYFLTYSVKTEVFFDYFRAIEQYTGHVQVKITVFSMYDSFL